MYLWLTLTPMSMPASTCPALTANCPFTLCRSFDSLNKGGNYKDILPAVQIGILDFTLFPEAPEFFATYRLMNVKSHKIYSNKLRLSVLGLKQIELATGEDRSYHIDCWARLFKATTYNEAARTAAVLSEDEKNRLQCEAREDYYRSVGWMKDEITQLNSERQRLNSENQQLNSELQRLRQLLAGADIQGSTTN